MAQGRRIRRFFFILRRSLRDDGLEGSGIERANRGKRLDHIRRAALIGAAQSFGLKEAPLVARFALLLHFF